MSKEQPLVSIIIPTFNRSHLISETLDSVLAQTYQNWECIIVDDGSTDNTDEVVGAYVKKDPRIQFHKRPNTHKPGGNGARNYGFEVSKGEYLQWFDDDDIMLKKFLDEKINVFTEELAMVICSGYYWDEENKIKNKIGLNIESNLFQDYVVWRLHILTPSILFKKVFLADKLLFSDKISRGQETELFSRLFFQLPEASFTIINKPLFLYRQHIDTKSVKNKVYDFDFKESLAFINIENFKRSLIENDLEVVNYLYNELINLFFLGLEKKHYSNVEYILDNFTPHLRQKNRLLAFKFFLAGKVFLFLKTKSYRVRRYFKNFQFT